MKVAMLAHRPRFMMGTVAWEFLACNVDMVDSEATAWCSVKAERQMMRWTCCYSLGDKLESRPVPQEVVAVVRDPPWMSLKLSGWSP